MRLHELAKELGANSKDLLAVAKGIGMPVKSHSSSLAPGQVSLLKAAYLYADEDDEEALLQKIEDKEAERKRVEAEEKEAQVQKAKERRQAEAETIKESSEAEKAQQAAAEQAESQEEEALKAALEVLADPPVPMRGDVEGEQAPVAEAETKAPEADAVESKTAPKENVASDEVPTEEEPAAPMTPVEATSAPAKSESEAPKEVVNAPVADPTPVVETRQPAEKDGDPAREAAPAAASASTDPKKPADDSKTRRGARILGRIELPQATVDRAAERSAPAARSGDPASGTAPSAAPGRGRGTEEEREKAKSRGRKSSARKWQPNEEVEAPVMGSGPSGRVKFWQRGPARRPHGGGGRGRGRGRAARPAKAPTLPNKSIVVNLPISVKDLSQALGIKTSDILKNFLLGGVRGVNINSVLDEEEAVKKIAADFKRDIEIVEAKDAEEQFLEDQLLSDEPEGESAQRAPVVTFLGHVDHGKTSLLDRIRSANVADGEAGGITQHVSSYRVTTSSGQPITFLDTPGHRAFTEMRLRGAKMTDVAVLVVAADDGVMPQTEEAYDHLKAADPNMPIVVALNKIDKADANPMRAKQQLAGIGLLPEEFGGETGVIEVSAITGDGIDDLLERLSLEAEVRELNCHPEKRAEAIVVEARKDDEIGIAATVLVQDGTLNIRDHFLCGLSNGRVRAMFDDRGNPIETAGPSVPVLVVGFDEVPHAGDQFLVVENGKKAREVVDERRNRAREASLQGRQKVTLENLSAILSEAGQVHEIKIVLKADVQGTLEVVRRELSDLKHDEVKIRILRDALGGITEDDVLLALASEAVIIGFNVIADEKARQTAEARSVDVRTYQVIYEILDDIKKAMEGALKPVERENVLGHATIRQVFKVSRFGNIAGCMVTDGLIQRSNRIRLIRDGKIIFTGRIDSLKRVKDDAREVKEGFECGIKLAGFNDVKIDDVIESFEVVEEKRELALG